MSEKRSEPWKQGYRCGVRETLAAFESLTKTLNDPHAIQVAQMMAGWVGHQMAHKRVKQPIIFRNNAP